MGRRAVLLIFLTSWVMSAVSLPVLTSGPATVPVVETSQLTPMPGLLLSGPARATTSKDWLVLRSAVVFDAADDLVEVPDVVGMTVAKADETLTERGLVLDSPSPEGLIASQDPSPGIELKRGSRVTVKLEDTPTASPTPAPTPTPTPEPTPTPTEEPEQTTGPPRSGPTPYLIPLPMPTDEPTDEPTPPSTGGASAPASPPASSSPATPCSYGP